MSEIMNFLCNQSVNFLQNRGELEEYLLANSHKAALDHTSNWDKVACSNGLITAWCLKMAGVIEEKPSALHLKEMGKLRG